jgi:hypothetical protein
MIIIWSSPTSNLFSKYPCVYNKSVIARGRVRDLISGGYLLMSYNLGKILSVNRKGFYFILLKDFVDGNFDCKIYRLHLLDLL